MVVELQKTFSQLDILAPAGSAEQLFAAVNNGCDAVYLGLDEFNARMKAPNFSADNLAEYVDYCHLFGVKVFVTINTSVKNSEFARALQLLKVAYLCNADGVIVTDLALMKIAGNLPKPFEVVASTQLNVHDKYGAEFVKRLGATTVVCARECSLNQIREIGSTGVEVECFLHGAMCVCQSGQCLFSSMVGGNSGNRGLCAQPCRKYYVVEGDDTNGGYLLSARDICSLDTLDELANAGATTFKIEGRNRRAEYAGIASRVYKRLLDGSATAVNGRVYLEEMFNRGMSSNHYLHGGNDNIIFPAIQNHTGVVVGVVKNGGVSAACTLRKGDGLKVYDGVKEVCGGLVLDDWDGKSACSSVARVQFSGKVYDGMLVHRTTSVALCNEALSARRKLNASLKFVAKAGRKPLIVAQCNGISATIEGDFVVQQAQNKPTLNEEIAKQLQKTGNSHYTICDIVIESGEIFIVKSQINTLRRQVLDKLSQKIIESYNRQFAVRKNVDTSFEALVGALSLFKTTESDSLSVKKATTCAVMCCSEEQLSCALNVADYLIFKPNQLDASSLEIAVKSNAFVDLPSFANLNFVVNILGDRKPGIVCNNVGQVEFARQLGLKYIAGSGLNLFNDYIVKQFDDCVTYIYSRELTLKEIEGFENSNGLTFVDGKISLMQLCHCPYKVAFKRDCSECQADKKLVYRDELGNRFEIIRRQISSQCLFELVNGNKLSVVSRLKNSGRYLIDYDKSVLRHYLNVNNGIADNYEEKKPYTKGRLYDKIN